MNLREGIRRMALLLGGVGLIAGGFASYAEFESAMNQRREYRRFDQLANSPAAQRERKLVQGDWLAQNTPKPQTDPSALRVSEINTDGINTIGWRGGGQVAYIMTRDGQMLLPTSAPTMWSYLLITIPPLVGFFFPWAVVRAIGWVLAGFVHPAVIEGGIGDVNQRE